uniref:SKA complex subunit 1 n=1 Tax=Syphacia muris TaxID=451379 RepID=A0A158R3T9_9BILA
MATGYSYEVLKFLNNLKQQSVVAMQDLDIRQEDVDEVANMHENVIECCQKMHCDIETHKKSLLGVAKKYQEELQHQAELLQIGISLESENNCKEFGKKVSAAVKSVEKSSVTEASTTQTKKREPVKHGGFKNRETHLQMETVPIIQDVNAKELLSVRKLGKISLLEINAIISEINALMKEKHDILRRTKQNLNNYDRKRIANWTLQLDKYPGLKGRFLVTEAEALSCLTPKVKAQFRIALLCLTALNRIEVIQCDEYKFLAVP